MLANFMNKKVAQYVGVRDNIPTHTCTLTPDQQPQAIAFQ